MDYEKKYNEALDRARNLMAMYPQDAPGYKEVFPELRESEDERIRKEIIELLKEVGRDDTGISENAKCMIAWLEKQKENPKSADSIPSDCVSDAKCEDKSPKHSDSDGTDIRDTPAYWKGWDDAMKQKEQEHPNGCFTCDEYKKGYEAGRLNGFTAGYNKAMKEVDQKEQKRGDRFEEAREKYQVEWSEEDRDRIAQYLHDRDGGMLWSKATEITRDILDMLRPQPKAGLTLFDENIIKAAVAFVEQNDHFNCWGGVDKHTVIKALRSLKPHWKPSEEQMEILGKFNDPVLKSLYEQLKRLKGGVAPMGDIDE